MNDSGERVATFDDDDRLPTPAELERLFNMSLDMVCIAGLDGFFKHVNPAFTRTLGYREEDLLSKAFVEFVHPDDVEPTNAEVMRLAEGLDTVDFENRYLAADGTWRWLEWKATSLPEEGVIFAIARDITENKQLQELTARQAEELAHSNADLEQFAAVASHDLQAPLRAVGNLADWIEEDLPDDAPTAVSDNFRALRDRLEKMQKLVADLLLYARVGRDKEMLQQTDVTAMVESITVLLGAPDGFTVIAADGLPVFETTTTPLEQVLRNLIANAIAHHDGTTGTVTVAARARGDYWEFSVSDDGPGIPEGQEQKVFDMLWSHSRGDHRGAGIGLALVKRIVERVDGRVWVEPADGRGTVFCFTWPKSMGG